MGQRFDLGKNKGVSDGELLASYRAMRIFPERQERGVDYAIFSDSTAAIERATTDRVGPDQALARAIIKLEELLIRRGCSVTIRWPSAHEGLFVCILVFITRYMRPWRMRV